MRSLFLALVAMPVLAGIAFTLMAADGDSRSPDPASVATAKGAMDRHQAALMQISGVIGVGVGASAALPGQAVVEVYVEKDSAALRASIPGTLDGVPVTVVETGAIRSRPASDRRD
ncbi:MAG TPA: hypothetical protein VGT40_20700 [Methylomirabilota bacterium]|jgi:hypothetical protein|nr:hypothetical protein [Methylomirabilota bacterium]